jgi:Ca2+-binding EF-hand superfamily protein
MFQIAPFFLIQFIFYLFRFLIAYVATNGTEVREKLEYVFQIYDRDNNKVIDQSEIKLVLKSMFKLLNVNQNNVDFERCLKNIMSSLDVNKDSKISKAEFIDGILNDSILYALLSPFS